MLCSLNLEIARPCPCCNHKIFGLDFIINRILSILLRQLSGSDILTDDIGIFGADDGIFILEGSQTIQIVHVIDFIDIRNVSEINWFNVSLDFVTQLVPVKSRAQAILILSLVHTQLPPIVVCIDELLMIFGSLMHQFFRNAAHIHTSTSQSPLSFVQTLLNEVDHYHV